MLVKPEDLFWFLKFVSLWLFFFSLPLLFLVYVWPSLFPPSPQEFSDCHFTRHARGRLLGLGDEQRVRENEEMSLLRLQARLQLRLGVAQEQAAWTLGQETLDQGTGLRADWRQAAFPGGKNTKEHTHKKTNKVKFFKISPEKVNSVVWMWLINRFWTKALSLTGLQKPSRSVITAKLPSSKAPT